MQEITTVCSTKHCRVANRKLNYTMTQKCNQRTVNSKAKNINNNVITNVCKCKMSYISKY